MQLFFRQLCSWSEYLLKKSDILFGSEFKHEIWISQAAEDNSILVPWGEPVVIMHSYAKLLRWSERVLIIPSPRASPSFKSECETAYSLSSYIFFGLSRIKDGVNWYSD